MCCIIYSRNIKIDTQCMAKIKSDSSLNFQGYKIIGICVLKTDYYSEKKNIESNFWFHLCTEDSLVW